MSDNILIALIAGLFGAVPAFIALRRQPSRKALDQISLAGGYGNLVEDLTEEIDRLQEGVTQARQEADGARAEARACRDENRSLRRRIDHLEDALRSAGIDPDGIVTT